jgi:hypothetical protein
MNAHPQLVFSRTLKEPLSWSNARLAARDPASEITALKQRRPGVAVQRLPRHHLKLIGTTVIDSAIVLLDYRPD